MFHLCLLAPFLRPRIQKLTPLVDDANAKEAAEWALFGIVMNVGQVCAAGSRVLVQEGIADEFTREFVQLMKNIKVGDPFDESSTQGPLQSAGHFGKVKDWIKRAVEEGAELATGGDEIKDLGDGYYLRPTVFTNVKPNNSVLANEVFGPVVSIQVFKTEEEAIKIANETSYGLASAVFSNNNERLHRLNTAIRAGTVWNNLYNYASPTVPFGGYKQSGIGRENGEAVLHEYLEIKSIIANSGVIRSPMAVAAGR